MCNCGRNHWKEFWGMGLYKCNGESFYAWGWKDARKKKPTGSLYIINDYGKEILTKA